MDRNELHTAVLGDISNRNTWESRQRTWYQMRHDGLRRRAKPWPGAADLHFPLADTIIGKLKPYYFEQLFATDTIATFVAKRRQDAALTGAAARWFDYKVKQQSNLEEEILGVIDNMLMTGRATCKTTWDVDRKRLNFDSPAPLKIIVPSDSSGAETLHRICHVMVMSLEDYRANPLYNQKEYFVKGISGRGYTHDADQSGLEQQKDLREGLTYSTRKDEIVVWEVYEKVDDEWIVYTYSPLDPKNDIRAPFALPYNHGSHPFADAAYEVKDKGWYSPRGIVELVAAHEASLCKLWNEKHDAMTLYNRPLYRSPQPLPNQGNLQFKPGQVLPYDIQPIPQASPPVSWDEELTQTRMIAEQRVAVPDYGMNQVMDNRDRRTATEIQSINEVMGNAGDLRMRIFRRFLGKVYQQAWSLLVQYDRESLEYCLADQYQQMDPEALHGDYAIFPTGSMDGVSKVFNQTKAVQRFQMFNGDPFINQAQLRKSILEADEPALVRDLLVDPMINQATQQEDQAQEISILRDGFPARVLPSDDHEIHIQTCVQYLQSRQDLGKEFDQLAHDRILAHVAEHVEALKEQNPNLARQVIKMLQSYDKGPGQQQLAGPAPVQGAPEAASEISDSKSPDKNVKVKVNYGEDGNPESYDIESLT